MLRKAAALVLSLLSNDIFCDCINWLQVPRRFACQRFCWPRCWIAGI